MVGAKASNHPSLQGANLSVWAAHCEAGFGLGFCEPERRSGDGHQRHSAMAPQVGASTRADRNPDNLDALAAAAERGGVRHRVSFGCLGLLGLRGRLLLAVSSNSLALTAV